MLSLNMACHNRNLPEYKALLDKYKSNIEVDLLINSWQKIKKDDSYPSLLEAEELRRSQKLAYNVKVRDFELALVANLQNKNYIHSYKNTYFVTSSNQNLRTFDETIYNNNLRKIYEYLDINNIPRSFIQVQRATSLKGNQYATIAFNKSVITSNDLLEKSRDWDKPKARSVVRHLMRLFPNLNINLVSVDQARDYYKNLPEWQKANINFENVRSLYNPYTREVILIKGRVTNETAIEEVLHPFIDAIYMDNRKLFDSMLVEAKKMFPVLTAQIEDSYSDEKGFDQTNRDLELVTQALSRHFKKEYEENPTKTFLERVKEFLKWFADIINDLHKYITGKNLKNLKEQKSDIIDLTTSIKPNVEELFDSNPKLAGLILNIVEKNVGEVSYIDGYFRTYGQYFEGSAPIDGNYGGTLITERKYQKEHKKQALQLYSQYLDSIFPDSEIKDIVYHGGRKGIIKFKKGKQEIGNRIVNDTGEEGIYFVNNIKVANTYALRKAMENDVDTQTYSVIINSKNIKNVSISEIGNINSKPLEDTYLATDKNGNSEIVVFEPEQIHILGSTQDIEGFKEFVDKNKKTQRRRIVFKIDIKDINANAKLSDIARLLNTSDIFFDSKARPDAKIRYSLSEGLQKTYDHAFVRSNDIQKEILKRLFHQSLMSDKVVESLSASESGPLIVLNESDHTYYDILNNLEVYRSTTERIKGKLSEEDKFNKKLNIELGNDFDKLLQGLASDKTLDEVFDQMKILSKEQAERGYIMLQSNLAEITRGDGVAIPQVVVYDEATKTAGTIDILVILPDGKLRIIDLKTSKYTVRDKSYNNTYLLKEDSDLKKFGVEKLSTRAQQGLQVNAYRRMLENMGYEVDMGDMGASTFHIFVGVTGKDAEQVFTGEFQHDDWISHPANVNNPYVNMLIPYNEDIYAKEDLKNKTKDSDAALVDTKNMLTPDEQLPENSTEYLEYATVFNALEAYKGALYTKFEALEKIKSSIFMNKSKKDTKEGIMHTISMINIALSSTPTERSRIFTTVLRDALKEVNAFADYMKNPDNFNKPEYITYALNFDRFKVTFRGLSQLKDSNIDGLNETQKTLILQLQSKLNEAGESTEDRKSLVDQAIINYVKGQVRTWTKREDLTEQDLDDLMNHVKDIPKWELQLNDMATSSDTLLAIVDKIYKAKVMRVLDNAEAINATVANAASKLQKLSSEKDPQKLFLYMVDQQTNRVVTRIGKQYYKIQEELRDKLYDENGNEKQYRDVTDISTASKEDIEYNIELAKLKEAYRKFWEAESLGPNNKLDVGGYHRYTDEFIVERQKYQYYVNVNGKPIWKRKPNISERAYQVFLSKYFYPIDYISAKKDKNGNYTGVIVRASRDDLAVKPEYRIVNDYNKFTGESLTDPRYDKIMNAEDELGRAQKEFYLIYTRVYNEYLEKLPPGIRAKMLGKIPLVANTFFTGLKNKPNIIAKMWAKSVRKIDDFLTTTAQQRALTFDENGNIVDQLPLYYIGNVRDEKKLEEIQNQIDDLTKSYQDKKISRNEYDKKLALLNGQYINLRDKPSSEELSLDLAGSLMRFVSMSEYYDVMNGVEDTFKAFLKVIEDREYQPSDPNTTVGKYVKKKFVPKGLKGGLEENTVVRMKKWMSMVFYDNDKITKNKMDKLVSGLIQYSSLSYVAFNVLGNINNYTLGRINNSIEAIGRRFYSGKAYMRAEFEFNKRAIPDIIHRWSASANKTFNKSDYDPELPGSKYEALVSLFRMMDDKADLRENINGPEPIKKSWYRKASDFGYSIQDAAEYNVQTKVGMALIIDTQIMNKKTGDILSLYDAFEFDSETKNVKLKEGYDTIVTLDKNSNILKEEAFTDDFRYKLRNEIREVNKQIHGNYAKNDRMVIQSHALGQLAAQFHKWIVPAIKARFRREYFDENLGWMEGRYISFFKFLKYSAEKIRKAEFDIYNYKQEFLERYNYKGDNSQLDEYALNKLFNVYRTLGEIGLIMTTLMLSSIFDSIFEEDDDDPISGRFKNALMYQADRSFKELILFTPTPGGLKQLSQILKSPLAATRTLGELGEALESTVMTGAGYLIRGSDGEFYSDSDYVYQRGTRAGQLKLKKQWMDAVPLLYSIKKLADLRNRTDFYIK